MKILDKSRFVLNDDYFHLSTLSCSICILLLLNIFLFGCCPHRYTKKESSNNISIEIKAPVSTSPYNISIEQPDGTTLEVIGKGNRNTPYTETTDGYTILRNNEGIYEYAVLGDNGKLQLSGTKAQNNEKRSKKEKAFLKTINKHLRNHYE